MSEGLSIFHLNRDNVQLLCGSIERLHSAEQSSPYRERAFAVEVLGLLLSNSIRRGRRVSPCKRARQKSQGNKQTIEQKDKDHVAL